MTKRDFAFPIRDEGLPTPAWALQPPREALDQLIDTIYQGTDSTTLDVTEMLLHWTVGIIHKGELYTWFVEHGASEPREATDKVVDTIDRYFNESAAGHRVAVDHLRQRRDTERNTVR